MCNILFHKATGLTFAVAFLLASGLGGCGDEVGDIRNLNGGRIEVIGHGGNGFLTITNPTIENSAASIDRALDAEGADGVEVDVRFTSDGVPVLFHDREMSEDTTCHGCISTTTAAELRSCSFRDGVIGNPNGQDSILSLESLVQKLKRRRPLRQLHLDLKVLDECSPTLPGGALGYVGKMEELIRRHEAYGWIVFKTGTLSLAAEMKRLNPKVKVLLANHDFSTVFKHAVRLGLFGIILEQNRISKAQVAQAHAKGLWVVVYGVKSRVGAVSAVNLWPDSIHTDRIRILRAVLNP